MFFFLSFTACQPQDILKSDKAEQLLIAEFEKQNKTERVSWLLKGQGQWLEGSGFNFNCLGEKDLAFEHHRKPSKIQPTLSSQQYFTDKIKKGYCLDLGEGLSISMDYLANDDASINSGSYRTKVSFKIKTPTPWATCLNENSLNREIYIQYKDGKATLKDSSPLIFREDELCPQPGSVFVPKKAKNRPTTPPPKAPKFKEIQKLFNDFDQALYDFDYKKALDLISCANAAEAKWGYCTAVDLMPLGPVTKGDQRPRDGSPWLANTVKDFKSLNSFQRDPKDPTLYHIRYKDRRDKSTKSISIQYVDGKWKLFGVVWIIQQGVTPLSFVMNLHEKEVRGILERRLSGEQIDHKGNPLNPYEKKEE